MKNFLCCNVEFGFYFIGIRELLECLSRELILLDLCFWSGLGNGWEKKEIRLGRF